MWKMTFKLILYNSFSLFLPPNSKIWRDLSNLKACYYQFHFIKTQVGLFTFLSQSSCHLLFTGRSFLYLSITTPSIIIHILLIFSDNILPKIKATVVCKFIVKNLFLYSVTCFQFRISSIPELRKLGPPNYIIGATIIKKDWGLIEETGCPLKSKVCCIKIDL